MTEKLKPMLANAIDIEEVTKKAKGYVMEPKLDGVRCLMNGNQIWTRQGKPLELKLPWLAARFNELFGSDVVLDGEIGYWKNQEHPSPTSIWQGLKYTGKVMDFNKTMRVIGSGPDEAIRKVQENLPDPLMFCAFDVLFAEGFTTNMPDKERRELLKQLFAENVVDSSEPFTIIDRYPEFDNAYLQHIFSLGGEGIMLKNPDAEYQLGKRPARHWYKIKAFKTADVFITGFDPGQGKYEGQVGALHLSAYNAQNSEIVLVGKCSGFTDDLRIKMTQDFDAYRFKTIEVKYFGRVGLDQGGLRHPQFVRFRPDKDSIYCTVQDL